MDVYTNEDVDYSDCEGPEQVEDKNKAKFVEDIRQHFPKSIFQGQFADQFPMTDINRSSSNRSALMKLIVSLFLRKMAGSDGFLVMK